MVVGEHGMRHRVDAGAGEGILHRRGHFKVEGGLAINKYVIGIDRSQGLLSSHLPWREREGSSACWRLESKSPSKITMDGGE